ncbi:hypothetical protein CDD83_6377 [Cordyceps sp. RAO-2017]|nr:hypothetical protein CDD83_6377 [Cordyceps sp. RAO-2017]
MLGPLSPSGQIPGLGDGADPSFLDPPNVDLDQYFDSSAFLNDAHFGADGNDFNFSLDTAGLGADPLGHGVVADGNPPGANGGGDAPSPTGTEEILRDDLGAGAGADSPGRDSKRRRVG